VMISSHFSLAVLQSGKILHITRDSWRSEGW
jgi:hypothetical protein